MGGRGSPSKPIIAAEGLQSLSRARSLALSLERWGEGGGGGGGVRVWGRGEKPPSPRLPSRKRSCFTEHTRRRSESGRGREGKGGRKDRGTGEGSLAEREKQPRRLPGGPIAGGAGRVVFAFLAGRPP